MADYDQLQHLIGEIYDSALDPAQWSTTLARLAASFGGNGAVISDKNFRNNQVSFVLQSGMCEEIRRLYAEHYLKNDLRFAAGQRMPPGSILHEPMFITEREMDRSDYYQNFLAPFDFRYHLGGALENSNDVLAAVVVQRSPRAGTFSPADIERFALLLPHFRRALQIQRRLGTLQRREQMLMEVIDRLPSGIVILDGEMRPVAMNRAAEAVVAAGDGLHSGPEGLSASHARQTAMLHKLIADALWANVGQVTGAGASLRLARPSGKSPLLLWVVPAGAALMNEMALAGPHALLFVSDPDARPHLSVLAPFIEFYGLTRAEVRLVEALANGLSPETISLEFGVSMATVRKHLQSVFGKTGVNRQADLVRLVLSSPLQFGATTEPSD